MLNGLSLFSGIGGIDIALRDWVKPVAYCEIEPYCQSVLLQRMSEGDLPKAPIWDDVTTLTPSEIRRLHVYPNFIPKPRGDIHIIYGGFPCQDISVAGAGKGLAGERSGLFFEIMRLAKEIKPKFIFLENVPAVTGRGGLQVVREITSLGYDCRWCVISAASVGALHRRERWFLLANSLCQRLEGQRRRAIKVKTKQSWTFSNGKNDSNTMCESSEQADCEAKPISTSRETWRDDKSEYWPFESRTHWQEIVSTICRVDDGVSNRVDRLKALGNAVVPIQAREAFKILIGLK